MFSRSKELSPAEIVERARKNVRHVERWGRWYAAFQWLMAIVYAVLFTVGAKLALDWGNNLAVNRVELLFGFIFGTLCGGLLFKVTYLLVEGRLSRLPDERDRLLVQYHDALAERAARDAQAERPSALR